jgi:hypothetical protein
MPGQQDPLDITGFYRLHADRARETERRKRQCLRCQKPFASAGPGHRMCARCRNMSEQVSPFEP